MKQYITRKGEFDATHRIMFERIKCYNLHGHRFGYELTFSFTEEYKLGYAIDFKEIKRVACAFIDDKLDHGAILNPKDEIVIDCCQKLNSKMWIMSLFGEDVDCNPSAEHISKEIFLAISILMNDSNLKLENIRLFETPNCWVDANEECITEQEKENFKKVRYNEIMKYREEKGIFEYDERMCNKA